MRTYILITEPARSTSVRVTVRDGVHPDDALMAWASEHDPDVMTDWHALSVDEREDFVAFYRDSTDNDVRVVEETTSDEDTPDMNTFLVTITLGNDAMRTPSDIAAALERVAARVRELNPEDTAIRQCGGTIRDINGNTVGNWRTANK